MVCFNGGVCTKVFDFDHSGTFGTFEMYSFVSLTCQNLVRQEGFKMRIVALCCDSINSYDSMIVLTC